MRKSWVLGPIIVLLSSLLVVLASSPASAHTVWRKGSAVAQPNLLQGSWVGPVYGFPGNGRPCKSGGTTESRVVVKPYGDYVFVKDTCRDGRSAVALISGKASDGHFHKRICRNARGVGKWVRCNYNWPENRTKNIVAGVYNGSTGYTHFSYGSKVEIRERAAFCYPTDVRFCFT